MRPWFNFTRREKVGVISLSCIILVMLFLLNVNSSVYLPDPFDVDTTAIEYVKFNQEDTNQFKDFDKPAYKKKQSAKYQLSDFDPNQLDKNGWQDLGFSDKQAASIIKYRNNYGPFTSKEDVGKIYVIDEDKYKELEPYIVINEQGKENLTSRIDINSADEEELQKINGIGPVYAGRIIKYRNLLGGFHSNGQFSEIYGLDVGAIENLSRQVHFNQSSIKRIDIQNATKDELRKHPYISFEVAAAILKERESRELTDIEFLLEKGLMNEKEKLKLEPYFKF